MFIYLPYLGVEASIAVLSNKEVVQQRADAIKILNILHETPDADMSLRDKPIIKMWRGNEVTLGNLGLHTCENIEYRGLYDDGSKAKLEWHFDCAATGDFSMDLPSWWLDMRIRKSHQRVLVKLNPDHYSNCFAVVAGKALWPESADG